MFDPPESLAFRLRKDSPYSFKCMRCGVCCNNKRIRPSEREAAGLAGFLNLDPDRFAAECLDRGTGEIALKQNGDCVFLGPDGCRVHPARPFVCRLFPLGLIRTEDGGILFGIMPLHPDCLGVFDTDGTVEGDLRAQGCREIPPD